MKAKSNKQIILSVVFVNVLIFLDQVTKQLAEIYLKGKESIPIIKDVFELRYLENTSAAFGMDPVSLLHNLFHFEIFQNNPELYLNIRMGFFYLITILVIFLLIHVYKKIPWEKRYLYMNIVLLFFIAGAIGNLIDRISNKYVIDFFYFKLIDFPIFNVADIYVTCAAFAMIGLGLFYYKDEDIDKIFPAKERKNRSKNRFSK